MPAACIDSTSSNANPRSRSITSTRRVTSVGCGRGHDDPALARSRRARWRCRACSRPRGGSRAPRRSSPRTAPRAPAGWRARRPGCGRSSRGASHDSAAMSSRNELRDLRPLHLDHDLFAGDEPGRVHLRDRRRRDRLLVEAANTVVERAAEVDLDDGADVVERLGRHPVAQQLELGDQLVGEQPLAARDDLAELHVGRAEVLERLAQPAGDPGARLRPPVLEDRASRRARRQISVTVRARRPSGRKPARREQPRAPPGGCRAAGARSPSATGSASGSRTHGPRSLNAPNSRSGERSAMASGTVMSPPKLPAGMLPAHSLASSHATRTRRPARAVHASRSGLALAFVLPACY